VRASIVTALISVAGMAFAPSAVADTTFSSNWGGYATHGPGVNYRQVSGAWKQPSVSCVPGKQAYSAYWVGLGGYSPSSNALEQIGTEADCNSQGNPILSAWYELVPAAAVPISIPVHAGDTILATVVVSGHRVVLTLNDATRGRAFTKSMNAASIDVSSAEWVVEAPSNCIGWGGCNVLPLANFGSAGFTGAVAQQVNGHSGSISDSAWGATRIDLSPSGRRFVVLQNGSGGQAAAVPSALRSGGSAFRVTFSRVQVSSALFGSRRLLASVAVAHHP
jgi:hypothetical protein